LVAYPAFLLVPGVAAKLALAALLGVITSGWYAIPKARLYDVLHERSGVALAVGGVAGLAGSPVPLLLGVVAGAVGLAAAMWLLVLAPLVLLALVPLRRAHA
ncbi:MAG: MFS transporter, partial [Gaiellaceae bacterium]